MIRHQNRELTVLARVDLHDELTLVYRNREPGFMMNVLKLLDDFIMGTTGRNRRDGGSKKKLAISMPLQPTRSWTR